MKRAKPSRKAFVCLFRNLYFSNYMASLDSYQVNPKSTINLIFMDM